MAGSCLGLETDGLEVLDKEGDLLRRDIRICSPSVGLGHHKVV